MKTVLAIETSCDETGVAFVQYSDTNKYISLANALHSQIDAHAPYGGVFPMLAKREHGHNLMHLLGNVVTETIAKKNVAYSKISLSVEKIQEAIKHLDRETELQEICKKELENENSILYSKPHIDALVVTAGPGLEPALWVGISFTKFLSILWDLSILPVNHMEGHIASVLLAEKSDIVFPALALLISGGHTEVVAIENWGTYEVIGKTRDDAVGEAYDKAARILNLPYPGGPAISWHAKVIRDVYTKEKATKLCEKYNIKLPRPMIHSQNLDFSFSGLKTAVLYLVRDIKKVQEISEEILNLICYEFEESVVEVLARKLNFAYTLKPETKTLIVAGGVIANTYIRETIDSWCVSNDVFCFKPEFDLATDNAIMIGLAGIQGLLQQKSFVTDLDSLVARGGWRIDEVY
ncbi:MAG: tRNA (adenosine(37)-N6)-threonylcarbamoyltransferase complex transferase subunit TsaD [Patescibacteria group bacterium]